MNTKSKISQRIIRMTMIAMFCALAYISTYAFRIKVSFLTYEIKDAVITFGGIILGPIAALIMSLLVPLIEMFTISDTQLYGFIMNSIAAATFSLTVTLTCRFTKGKKYNILLGTFAGTVALVVVMMAANLLITPHFMGTTVETVKGLIPKLLLPFNLTKAILNSAIVILLNTYVLNILRKTGLVPSDKSSEPQKSEKKSKTLSVIFTILGIILAVVAILIFVKFLNGNISAGKR